MHFDDRLRTAMRDDAPQGAAALAQYRQLVDILAQNGTAASEDKAPSSDARRAALARIMALADRIDADDQLVTVQCLSGRIRAGDLVQALSERDASVANAALRAARLTDSQWAALIPALSARARGLLRHRRDLGPLASAMLDRYAYADRALPPAVAAEPVSTDAASPWGIAEATPGRDEQVLILDQPAEMAPGQNNVSPILKEAPRWRLHTDVVGRLLDETGALPPGAARIVLARAAVPLGPGVDAGVAAAFARRVPIRAGSLALDMVDGVASRWRIDADPVFDPASGRFEGYAGHASAWERAAPPVRRAPIEPARVDALRQILHELRTPLGAIQGFGEIIETGLFGPVSPEYRAMAGRIVADARYLLSGFDDLGTAIRIDSGGIALDPEGKTAAATLADRLAEALAPIAADRAASLAVVVEPGFAAPIGLGLDDLERTALRLGSALLGVAAPDERLTIRLMATEHGASVAFDRPMVLEGLDQAGMFDADRAVLPRESQPPLLGLGFALRLVDRLARLAGGALEIGDSGPISLMVPLAEPLSHRETEALE